MDTTILVVLAVVGLLLACWSVMKPIFDDNKVRGKVLNFDEGMKHYFFRFTGSADALRTALSEGREAPLSYEYDPEQERILFRLNGTEAAYALRFYENEGLCGLIVGREADEREKGNIPWLINAFFVRGFAGVPVDYRVFDELFPADSAQ